MSPSGARLSSRVVVGTIRLTPERSARGSTRPSATRIRTAAGRAGSRVVQYTYLPSVEPQSEYDPLARADHACVLTSYRNTLDPSFAVATNTSGVIQTG